MNPLLLHGFSRDASMWAPLAEGMALNLPGHAKTPAPVVDFDGVVDALAQLIETPRGVIGYSMGGRLALALAARYPTRVRWLVLDGASLGLQTEAERAARRESDARWVELLRTRGIDAFTTEWEAQPLFGGAAHVDRHLHDPQGLATALERLGKGAMPWLGDAAARVRCPVLLLNGERDSRGLVETAQLAERMPHAQRRTLPGHHAAHLEAPAVWRAHVADFLRRTDLTGPGPKFPAVEANA